MVKRMNWKETVSEIKLGNENLESDKGEEKMTL